MANRFRYPMQLLTLNSWHRPSGCVRRWLACPEYYRHGKGWEFALTRLSAN